MKVVQITGKFGLDALKVTDRPDVAPGPGQILVRWRAFSLNYRDLLVVKGLYNPRLPLPFVPLSDAAGEVAAVGDAVTRVRVGDRVASLFMQDWQAGELTDAKAKSALGGALPGVFAEASVLSQDGVIRFPQHLTFEEAATLPCAALTAWHALVTEGRLRPGDTVLTQGTGGVSIFALQFARLAGAQVIVTSGSDQKLERARALGAAHGVNYKTTPQWDDRVRELTGGRGADHVIEVGGVGTFSQSVRAVRAGGRVSLIGVLTGGTGPVNLFPVLMKNVRVQGVFVGSRNMFEDMNRAVTPSGLRPVVDRVFPFDDAAAAFRYLDSGAHFGKVCVRV